MAANGAILKICIFEVEPWERASFEQFTGGYEVCCTQQPLTSDNVDEYRDADIVSVFIYSDLHAGVLDRLDNLKFVATRSTGFDHVDVEQCRRRNIAVSNVPIYGTNTVAEHVFALLLALSHRVVEAVDRTRRGDFSQQGLQGFDLQGKTFGVVGTGDIGRCVLEIAGGFRMDVLAYDIEPDEALVERLDFAYVDFDELLERSDIISLHVPLNEQTRYMLDEEEFERMKDGVVIINTARGSVINVEALLFALSSGKVAAAGLDVLPDEPTIREEAQVLHRIFREKHDLETLLADHLLLRMRNVIITPHSAFNTKEAIQRILDATVENLVAFLEGEPINLVI
jgi:D-lactate dehydrogenase